MESAALGAPFLSGNYVRFW